MKKVFSSTKFIALVALALILAVFAFGCGGDEGLSVSDVQHDPFAFTGEITINGTVAHFAQDNPNLFGVMDTEELLQCGRFDCGAWIMPSLFAGSELPALQQGDTVIMTGQFTRMDDMVVFQVTDMDVGNNIMNRLP